MASGKNLLKTSLTQPQIQCLINPPLNNNLFNTVTFHIVVRATFIYASKSFSVEILCWADDNGDCVDVAANFW